MIALVARVALDVMRRSDRGTDERRRSQFGTILLLAVAGVGFLTRRPGHAQLPRPRRRRREG
jgi:hypothetical protein